MREILFRGKRVDNGEWVQGNLFIPDIDNTPTQICIGTNIIRITYDIIPETIEQYTGLTDKNGKKIFEGDIISYEDGESYLVTFNGGCFRFGAIEYGNGIKRYRGFQSFSVDKYNLNEVEVIGNIHDNPELLGGEKL